MSSTTRRARLGPARGPFYKCSRFPTARAGALRRDHPRRRRRMDMDPTTGREAPMAPARAARIRQAPAPGWIGSRPRKDEDLGAVPRLSPPRGPAPNSIRASSRAKRPDHWVGVRDWLLEPDVYV